MNERNEHFGDAFVYSVWVFNHGDGFPGTGDQHNWNPATLQCFACGITKREAHIHKEFRCIGYVSPPIPGPVREVKVVEMLRLPYYPEVGRAE